MFVYLSCLIPLSSSKFPEEQLKNLPQMKWSAFATPGQAYPQWHASTIIRGYEASTRMSCIEREALFLQDATENVAIHATSHVSELNLELPRVMTVLAPLNIDVTTTEMQLIKNRTPLPRIGIPATKSTPKPTKITRQAIKPLGPVSGRLTVG